MPLFSVYHGSNQQSTLLSTDCSAGVLNATLVDIANNNSSVPINEINHTESTNNTSKPIHTKEKNDLITQHGVKYKHVELIPLSFLHELASNSKTVHLLHQIQRYRYQQQHQQGNTEARLSLSSLSGNLPNYNNFIMAINVNNSGNSESPSSTTNTNSSTSSNVINNTAIQSLLHNIPFVGLMNAPVQLPVCDLPGMSSLASNIIPPNFSSIGAATSNANLASVIGTNNFVLIGCRESNSSEEQIPHTNLQTHTPSLLSQEQHHQESFTAEHHPYNIHNTDNNDNDAMKLNTETILEKARKISNKSIWQDVNKVALNNYNNTDVGENTQSAHMTMNINNSDNHTTTTTTITNSNNNYIPNAFTRATAQVALNSTLSASSATSNASSGKGRSNSPSSTSNTSSNKHENKNNNNNNSNNKQKNKNVRNSKNSTNVSTQNTPREKNISKSPERADLSLQPELSLSMNNKTTTTMNNINLTDTMDKEKEEELQLAKRIQEYKEQHIKPVQHIPVNVHAVHSIMANHSYNDDSNIQYSPARLVTRLLVDEVVREEMQHEKEEKEATNTNGDDKERPNLEIESEYMSGELNTQMFHQIDTHNNNNNVLVSNSSTTVSNKNDFDNITKPKEVQVIYENTEIPLSHAAHSLLNASSNYTSNLSSSFTSATLNNTSNNINMNTLNNTSSSNNTNNPFVVSLANCTVNVRNIPVTTNNNINSCHSNDPFSRNHFNSTNEDNNDNENTEPWSHLLERMQSFDVIYKTSSTTGIGKESSKHEDELLSVLLEEYLRFMKGKFDVARQQYRAMCEAASGHYSNHRHNSNAINNSNESGLSKSRSKANNDKATKKKKK